MYMRYKYINLSMCIHIVEFCNKLISIIEIDTRTSPSAVTQILKEIDFEI
jgi:hypothetical protein